VIKHPAFHVDPWCLRANTLDLDVLAQSESVFALANGHIGWRGNLDEGEPHGLPGSYLNGFYELRPLPYAEAGYGYPESGQTVINVTNGKLIRLFVDDEPFDLRYGELRRHEQLLDFRSGLLHRSVEWTSPAGRTIRVRSVRLVSFVQRSVAAISYDVEAVDGPTRIVVQSELVANEQLPIASGDPRVAAVLEAPLVAEAHDADGARVGLVHRTSRSHLRMGAAADHTIRGPRHQVISESSPDRGRVTVTATIEPGQPLNVVKFVAYGWSAKRSLPAVRDQVDAALVAAKQIGWDGLVAEQHAYLDDFWERADVEVEGDTEIQQATRFALFHVLQSSARAEGRAIPAKGLTGPGYDGHAFWDTETFVLPVLTYTAPDAAADALRWRHTTLPLAIDRASQLGLAGAAFPWRTITGHECSGYWPAGTAAFHVGADIADAVLRYITATGDATFEQGVGLDLLVATARLWQSLGHYDANNRFRIDGVTGPDEYSAIADNNIYTNLMAQQNLRAAADLGARYPQRLQELHGSDEEIAGWRDAAEAMVIPYDADLGIHPQAEAFTAHQVWDFAHTTPDQYPLLLHFPYFDLYRKQVVKQADLVLAMQLQGHAFTNDAKARNFDYYERLTVRDSSLSACSQAVVAAEVGQLALAYDYLAEAALMDLDDVDHNTRDGLHMASLASVWTGLVAGFGGMRVTATGSLSFSPRLPQGLTGLMFRIIFQGRRLSIDISAEQASYRVVSGDPIELLHHDEVFLASPERLSTLSIPLLVPRPTPSQPHGRVPAHR